MNLRLIALLFAAAGATTCAAPTTGRTTFPGGVGTSPGSDGGSGPSGIDGGTTCDASLDDDGGSGPGLVVSEIAFGPSGFIELFNRDAATYPADQITLSVAGVDQHPTTLVGPDEHVVVSFPDLPANGEVVVRADGDILAYACWGQPAPSIDQNDAFAAGAWESPGSCALPPPAGESLHSSGSARFAAEFSAGPPSPACP